MPPAPVIAAEPGPRPAASIAAPAAAASSAPLEADAAGPAAPLVSGGCECTLSLPSCLGRWGGLCAESLDGRSPPVSVRMRGGSQLVDRFSSRRLGEGRPSRSAGRAVGEAAEAQPLCACCKVVAAAIDACADAGVGATAVTAAAAAASLSAGSVDADATDAEAAPELSPSTKSGALAIQTGQPSSVGAVRLRFELKLGLGGWNCGLKTLGCVGVDSVNEGVRSAAFDEGVRLAGRLRLYFLIPLKMQAHCQLNVMCQV